MCVDRREVEECQKGIIADFKIDRLGRTTETRMSHSPKNITLAVSGDQEAPKDRATILLVEDEKVVRMVSKRRLEKLGYHILTAEHGKQALNVLETEIVDLIITDWMMPEMDGLALCDAIREDERWHSLYLILMTAFDQPAQIAEGLARGANDFLTKSASEEEINARVKAGLRTRQLIESLGYSHEVISQQKAEIEAELQSASEFVLSLFPPPGNIVPQVNLAWEYRPSARLGGDLFQVTRWGEEYLGLMVLDMSGHGIGPSLRAVSLAMTFRDEHMARRHPSYEPGEIVQRLNEENPLTDQGEYFTIWVGTLHLKTGELRYASAGHPGAILTRNHGENMVLSANTWPVGFGLGQAYRTQHCTLSKGDRLYLFTDGLYEVMNPEGKMWGQKGLQGACHSVHEKSLDEALSWVIQQSQDWQRQETFGDDVAIIGVDVLQVPEGSKG